MTDVVAHELNRKESLWTNQDIKRYFLALAHNTPLKDFSYEENKFPGQIALNKEWHEIFEKMRYLTARDNHERFSFVAVSKKDNRVILLENYVIAEQANEPLQTKEIKAALKKAGDDDLIVVAWIHSHPPGLDEWQFDQNELIKKADKLSVGDMWWLVNENDYPQAMFLVGTTKNQVIFKSGDSLVTEEDTQEGFMLAPKTRNYRSIAKENNLVVYEGNPNESLFRKLL